MKGNALDFSFSGLKTAVLRWVESHDLAAEIETRRELLRAAPHASVEQWLAVTPQATRDLLASFQGAVINQLVLRARASFTKIGARTMIVSGGVACNSGLRAAWTPYPVLFPSPGLSTDNAVMIAAAAFPRLARRDFDDFTLPARANLALA
jgi:N6-L-threonylcarbamoyladenine synthase